ncbi:MAG: zf-HC2 domain-containing protein [Spirochaetia bacterium]|jgi:hypothetical protein|nr:zf-HC2 domain-containing protein [Spirochaetia bacterium]
MCPDRETLSAFIDNEVEGSFYRVIEEHIASCSKCRKETEKLKKISSLCHASSSDNEIEEAQIRVWNRIDSDIHNVIRNRKTSSLWYKKVLIPFPVMAAAAAVFLIFAISTLYGFYYLNSGKYDSRMNFSEAVTINEPEDFNLFERELILEVNLNLPENTVFMVSGTPMLIREVDYHNINK